MDYLFVFHVCRAVLSVPCNLVVTCWEMTGPLTLLCVMLFCVFVTLWCPGAGVVFDCIESLLTLLRPKFQFAS